MFSIAGFIRSASDASVKARVESIVSVVVKSRLVIIDLAGRHHTS
jgi:hypothetical protein